MAKGDNVKSPPMDDQALNVMGEAVNIIKTMDIYCGRPTAGYQVVRIGLDVTFTPDLNKVHTLIDKYFNGQETESHRGGEDYDNNKEG
ncbi:MAG: hypothetical protein GTO13_08440 [Proteobacteria bacterium]|nr:hypothetical protein [Pseudomonadota bacterium]